MMNMCLWADDDDDDGDRDDITTTSFVHPTDYSSHHIASWTNFNLIICNTSTDPDHDPLPRETPRQRVQTPSPATSTCHLDPLPARDVRGLGRISRGEASSEDRHLVPQGQSFSLLVRGPWLFFPLGEIGVDQSS